MLRLLARGKINWSLDILGKRPDGYHEMDMLTGAVELADELTLTDADTVSLHVEGNGTLSDTDNLVLKAADALRAAAGCEKGALCTLTKRIPVGAGMGGGSADAAAALIGLNRLWRTALTEEQLAAIGLSVGADVPFLLIGGFARVGGIGEKIEAFPAPPAVPLMIVQPCRPVSTREAFAGFDALPRVAHPRTDAALRALQSGDLAALSTAAGNVLEAVGETAVPQIAEAIAALEACGAAYAAMTGSGSAVFGAFTAPTAAQAAFRALRKRWRKCWLTRTSAQGVTFL